MKGASHDGRYHSRMGMIDDVNIIFWTEGVLWAAQSMQDIPSNPRKKTDFILIFDMIKTGKDNVHDPHDILHSFLKSISPVY